MQSRCYIAEVQTLSLHAFPRVILFPGPSPICTHTHTLVCRSITDNTLWLRRQHTGQCTGLSNLYPEFDPMCLSGALVPLPLLGCVGGCVCACVRLSDLAFIQFYNYSI